MKIFLLDQIRESNPDLKLYFRVIRNISFKNEKAVRDIVNLVNGFSASRKVPLTIFRTDNIKGQLEIRPAVLGDVIEAEKNVVKGIGSGQLIMVDRRGTRAVFTKLDSYHQHISLSTSQFAVLSYATDKNSAVRVNEVINAVSEKILKLVGGNVSKTMTQSRLKMTTANFSKRRILSGVRPTNALHIGNYFGAIKSMVEMQQYKNYETYYFVATLSAMSTLQDAAKLREYTKNTVLDFLACGINPDRSTIFIQSDVPEHTELAHLFSSVYSLAKLQHLPTFKEKVKLHPENVSLSLLNYPILMAAGILLYKTDYVPVGLDQEPHLEVARQIARKMNTKYGTDFLEPKRYASKGEYIPSLIGEGKMSKSVEGSFINLTDSLNTIKKKLAAAPTDSGKGKEAPKEGGVANLLKFVELFEGEKKRRMFEKQYTSTGIKYAELKENLAKAIYQELKPIQKRRKELEKNPEYVDKVIKEGAEKAKKIASKTVEEVKEKMGLS